MRKFKKNLCHILFNCIDLLISNIVCPRTLMINADKAARDLDSDLIEDLKNEKEMEVTIILV